MNNRQNWFVACLSKHSKSRCVIAWQPREEQTYLKLSTEISAYNSILIYNA
jgi:invasion protein IalB